MNDANLESLWQATAPRASWRPVAPAPRSSQAGFNDQLSQLTARQEDRLETSRPVPSNRAAVNEARSAEPGRSDRWEDESWPQPRDESEVRRPESGGSEHDLERSADATTNAGPSTIGNFPGTEAKRRGKADGGEDPNGAATVDMARAAGATSGAQPRMANNGPNEAHEHETAPVGKEASSNPKRAAHAHSASADATETATAEDAVDESETAIGARAGSAADDGQSQGSEGTTNGARARHVAGRRNTAVDRGNDSEWC